MSVDDASKWIDAHQLLVVSVLIPLVSAIVASAASWYSTHRALRTERAKMVFEGELKIAEFRQAWINSLRDEMAEFQSYGILPGHDPTKEREFYKLGTKIELLMNPSDPDYPTLQSLMYSFLSAANGDILDKYGHNAQFVTTCQAILKREWDRLKSDIARASGVAGAQPSLPADVPASAASPLQPGRG